MKEQLIPVIIQHYRTLEVLTLAYMNKESFQKTLSGPDVWFYSRSRKSLWHKGETSGNYLRVKNITTDCDKDALLIKVDPDGPSCHTGNTSCFSENNTKDLNFGRTDFINELMNTINDRKDNPKKDSYVNKLFENGPDYISQKVIEELCETIVEFNSKEKNLSRLVEEISDLLFHLLILMSSKSISIDDLENELNSRKKN